MGGAALLGGAVIGLTGGLAAPAVVAGLGVLGAAVGVGGALAAGDARHSVSLTPHTSSSTWKATPTQRAPSTFHAAASSASSNPS